MSYAYITFRSMDALDLVKKSYSRYGACQRFCILKCCTCCCNKSREEIKKKHIFKKLPEITNACTPDNINWHNLGYGAKYRSCMVGINWLIAILMVILSLAFIVVLKQEATRLKKEYKTDIVCPA